MKNLKHILMLSVYIYFAPVFSQTSTYLSDGRQFAFCDATDISIVEKKSHLLPPKEGHSYCFKTRDNNFVLIEVRMIKMVGNLAGQ
jgi:hypothetical protein